MQEKILNNTREAKENDKLNEAQKKGRITQSKDDQLQNANNLKEMAQEGARTVQEAMKNPLFTEQAVRDWAQTLQKWDSLAKGKMNEAAEALKSAGQQDAQEAKAPQKDLAEAVQKEQDVLRELEKMQKKNEENMDKLHEIGRAHV